MISAGRWLGRHSDWLVAIAVASLAFDTVKGGPWGLISPPNLAFGLAAIAVVAARAPEWRLAPRDRWAIAIAAIFAVSFVPSVITSVDPSRALRLYISTLGVAGVFVVVAIGIVTRQTLRLTMYGWIVAGLILAVDALLQYGSWLVTGQTPGDTGISGICGTHLVTLRATAFTSSANYVGFFVLPLAIAPLGLAAEERRWRYWLVAAAVACGLAVFATLSRGAIGALAFAFGASVCLFVFARNRNLLLRTATVVTVGLVLLFAARTLVGFNEASLVARINIVDSALRAIGLNPLTGSGLGEVPVQSDINGFCERFEVITPTIQARTIFAVGTGFDVPLSEPFADLRRWHLVAGSAIGSIASGTLIAGDGANGRWAITAGPADWRDGRWSATAKVSDISAGWGVEKWRSESDLVRAEWINGSLRLVKVVGGVSTVVDTVQQSVAAGHWIWLELEARGTSYLAKAYDTESAVPGTSKESSRLIATTRIMDISGSAIVAGSITISSTMSGSEWGGMLSGRGGVYVEVPQTDAVSGPSAIAVATPTPPVTVLPSANPSFSSAAPSAAPSAVESATRSGSPSAAPALGGRDTHITVLQAAGTGGLLGLIGYSVLVLGTLWFGTRSWARRSRLRTALVVMALAVQVAALVADGLQIKQLYVGLALLWAVAALETPDPSGPA
jgi:O-antigen ligase/polysaccharide polymerase Wzy-like membrane protein